MARKGRGYPWNRQHDWNYTPDPTLPPAPVAWIMYEGIIEPRSPGDEFVIPTVSQFATYDPSNATTLWRFYPPGGEGGDVFFQMGSRIFEWTQGFRSYATFEVCVDGVMSGETILFPLEGWYGFGSPSPWNWFATIDFNVGARHIWIRNARFRGLVYADNLVWPPKPW